MGTGEERNMRRLELAIFPDTLGERMKRSRQRRQIDIGEMADHFEKSVETIRSWEQDRNQPRHFYDVVRRWAEICEVDREWLLTGYVPEDRLLMGVA